MKWFVIGVVAVKLNVNKDIVDLNALREERHTMVIDQTGWVTGGEKL